MSDSLNIQPPISILSNMQSEDLDYDAQPNNRSDTSATNTKSTSKYYACDDPNRPICRQYVNQGRCNKRKHCNFFHPKVVTRVIEKRARREPGYCYCSAPQRTIISNSSYRPHDGESAPRPAFFVVCSRTGRSINKCM